MSQMKLFDGPAPIVAAAPAAVLRHEVRSTPTDVHRHILLGCAPRPLSSYLKALGILRIVAEQVDPEVRGYWQNDAFVLLTRLDEDALVEFFLFNWQPNPFVSPWNKASGLLGSDAKGVEPLEKSKATRFSALRTGIAQARALTKEMEAAVLAEKAVKGEKTMIKDAAGKQRLENDPAYRQRLALSAKACKRLKDKLQPECQLRWRGPALRWLRTAVVIDSAGDASFPALLGTGGNDGKLEFTNNAMQRLAELFDLETETGEPRGGAQSALRAALFAEASTGLVRGPIGQFDPAASGGANATSGALAKSLVNPWDLPLLLEGALLFTAGTSRRLGGAASDKTVAPFSSRSLSAGYGSAALADETARGEQWMPLWSRAWKATEVAALLGEGRCQLGRKPSDSGLDVARAVARLGVARGVDAFERYAYIERNGKSNYAVPLGRWTVRAEPSANIIDDLDTGNWWAQLRRAARADRAPGSLSRLERRLGDTVLAALAHGGEPARWQAVLIALAEIEAQLVVSGSFTVKSRLQPIPRLTPAWIQAIDDNSAELRLALALAGAGAPHSRGGGPTDSVRRHWLPLEKGRFKTRDKALAIDPGVVLTGRGAEADLIRLVQRRITEASMGGMRVLPIAARRGTAADPTDVAALLEGQVDLDRTLWLARGLAALDWRSFDATRHAPSPARGHRAPMDTTWAALRLCHLAAPMLDGRHVFVDPSILRSLATGDASRAYSIVLRRLRSHGISVPWQGTVCDADTARRLAASLAFPISPRTASRLANELDPQTAHHAQEPNHVR